MKKRLFLLIALLLLLAACERGGGAAPTATGELGELGEWVIPTPTLDGGGAVQPGMEGLPTMIPTDGLPTVPPGLGGRFSNLRFSTSGNGPDMTSFPAGTEDIYAIWDYEGMSATDRVERVWYHNEAIEIERAESWDILKYGFTGTVRDVYHYNYEGSGVYPGTWRVEIYLNGELQLDGTFTVGQ